MVVDAVSGTVRRVDQKACRKGCPPPCPSTCPLLPPHLWSSQLALCCRNMKNHLEVPSSPPERHVCTSGRTHSSPERRAFQYIHQCNSQGTGAPQIEYLGTPTSVLPAVPDFVYHKDPQTTWGALVLSDALSFEVECVHVPSGPRGQTHMQLSPTACPPL